MNIKFVAFLATAGVLILSSSDVIRGEEGLFIIAVIWIGWYFSRKND
ncbi:MAG: hypothetical protein ABGY11_00780 [Candidatus Thioglobus sp.]